MKVAHFILFIMITFLPISLKSNDTITYDLLNESIKSAIIKQQGRYYAVLIKLKKSHEKDFLQLTRNNIGQRLIITYSEEVLSSAIIQTEISSGQIQVGEWISKKDAQEFLKVLNQNVKKNIGKRIECGGKDNEIKEDLQKALSHLSEYDSKKELKSLKDGLKAINQVIESDNEDLIAYYWKAVMLTKLGDIKEAISVLNDGIEKKEVFEHGNIFLLRGMLREKSGEKNLAFNDYNKSIEIYKKSLLNNPKNWDSILNISHALVLMHRKPEAVEMLKDLVTTFPNEDAPKQMLEMVIQNKIIGDITF